MNYAIGYTRSFRYFDEVDEVIFNWYGGRDIVTRIPEILKKNQRAIIDITEAKEAEIQDIVPILKKLQSVYPNMTILIDFFEQKDFIEVLKDNELSFFFSTFAKSYDLIYSMVKAGATDIYIVEELAFDLKNLQHFRKEGIKLRVFPDIAQSAKGCGKNIPAIIKFWIRPEDINEYAKYVDVIEFIKRDNRLSTIFEIYKQKQWLGEIKDIVSDFDIDLDNKNLTPHFGTSRTTCQKKCLIGKCNICFQMLDLADEFKKSGIQIIKKKERPALSQEEKDKIINDLKEKGKELNES